MFQFNSAQLNMFSTTYLYVENSTIYSLIYLHFFLCINQNGSWFSWVNTRPITSALLNTGSVLGLQQFYPKNKVTYKQAQGS